MKIKAIVETDSSKFTVEQLKKLQKTGADLPITFNFDNKVPLGIVNKIELTEDNKLLVYGTITRHVITNLDHFYLAIGYMIPSCKMTCYGVTQNPSDHDLPPIEILEQ